MAGVWGLRQNKTPQEIADDKLAREWEAEAKASEDIAELIHRRQGENQSAVAASRAMFQSEVESLREEVVALRAQVEEKNEMLRILNQIKDQHASR